MPQDSLPYILNYKDSFFIIHSEEAWLALPDSVRAAVDSDFHAQQQEFSRLSHSAPKDEYAEPTGFQTMMFVAFFIFIFLIFRRWKKNLVPFVNEEPSYSTGIEENSSPLHYPGNSLKFTHEELNRICNKYNSYYQKLSFENKQKFLSRLQQFIKGKQFYIYADKGYKEMPVLISAAAIQITLGLEEFMLPYFTNIIIHPDAYLADNPLRVLMGNVQGHSITLSWKHFLDDYKNPSDGKNVGLHEMAHALQVQYLFTKRNRTNDFREDFEHYDRVDDHVLQSNDPKKGLFDAYALKDKNELWATSVELFFERPVDLKLDYPELYDSIMLVLNQDPVSML
jgi:MtfA peptidase